MEIETKLRRDKTMPGPMEYSESDNKSIVATKKHYGQTRFGKQ